MNQNIQGGLETTRCPDIVKMLSLGKMTGRLFLSSGNETGSVYFRNGAIVHAVSGNIEGNKAIYEMAVWSSGSYKFFIDDSSDLITINASIEEILTETENRIRQMEKIASLIPSSSAIFQLDSEIKEKEVILKSVQWKVLSYIDGAKSISQIAQSIGITDSDAMKVFYTLFRQGLIKEIDVKTASSGQQFFNLPDTDFVKNLLENLTKAIGPIAPLIIKETCSETNSDLLSDDITIRAVLIETLHSKIPDEKAGLTFLDEMSQWLRTGEK